MRSELRCWRIHPDHLKDIIRDPLLKDADDVLLLCAQSCSPGDSPGLPKKILHDVRNGHLSKLLLPALRRALLGIVHDFSRISCMTT